MADDENGLVGFVEEGRTYGSETISRRSGRVPASRALDVVGVDRPPGDRGDRVLERHRLVDRVGVDHDLDVVRVGNPKRLVDHGRVRAQVLVDLEPGRAPLERGLQRRRARGRSRDEGHVDRPRGEGIHHALEREARVRADIEDQAHAAADQRRVAERKVVGHHLRAKDVDVAVDRSRRRDEPVGGDDPGRRLDRHVDAVHHVRVAGVADSHDLSVLDADVCLHRAEDGIEHEGARDAQIER